MVERKKIAWSVMSYIKQIKNVDAQNTLLWSKRTAKRVSWAVHEWFMQMLSNTPKMHVVMNWDISG